VCLEVVAQLFYKAGINVAPKARGPLLDAGNLLAFASHALWNWRVMLGLLLYMAEVLIWWIVLSRVDVSYAFPLTSMSYVLLLFASRLWLHERVSPVRWLGACTVMAGVYLITRSAPLPR
jgi:drug/metabolite transporter (DMT)-like permease